MTSIKIEDADLHSLKGAVVVVTGGSSGIGLATTKLLLDLGTCVVSGDLHDCPIKHEKHEFMTTDVTSWPALRKLFDRAKSLHGRIDHVFANAGIGHRANYLEDRIGEDGALLEPDHLVLDVNLKAAINTSYLGLHHMRHQDPPGGSVVVTASASSITPFAVIDYCTAKHGVLGFIRGTKVNLEDAKLPIRINGIAPYWTKTGLVPEALLQAAGLKAQSPEAVARSVALLMADPSRQGQFIYSDQGHYWEIQERLLQTSAEIMGYGESDIHGDWARVMEVLAQSRQNASGP